MFALSLIPLLMLPRPTFTSFERYFSALHLETFYPSARLLKAELAALSSQTCLSSHSACPLKYQPQELEGTWFLLFPWELSLVPFPSKFSLCMGLKKFPEKGPLFFRCFVAGLLQFLSRLRFLAFSFFCPWFDIKTPPGTKERLHRSPSMSLVDFSWKMAGFLICNVFCYKRCDNLIVTLKQTCHSTGKMFLIHCL